MALKIGSSAPSPRRLTEDLQSKLQNDGHVDVREAKELKKGWSSTPVTADAARELRQSVLGNASNLQPGARKELQRFIENKLPRLTANDPNAASAPRDVWGDLQLKSLGDGRISNHEAHRLATDWGSKPVTAGEAQQMTNALLSTTGSFESNGALRVMQRFLQDKLPGLVSDKENLPRSFDTELRIALMDDGHLDPSDTKKLIDGWKQQAFTPAQAKALTEAVLAKQNQFDPGTAREAMQKFLESELPTRTSRNPDGTAARRDHALDVKIKAFADGKIDRREARELTRAWDDPTLTPAEGEAIKQSLAAARLDGQASTALRSFVDRNLPRLILGQALSTPNNAKLTWTPPFANVDGTPLTNLAGYTVEYGKTAGAPDQTAQITDPAATGFTVENLTPGTWYFRVKARNTEGAESAPSNEAAKTVR